MFGKSPFIICGGGRGLFQTCLLSFTWRLGENGSSVYISFLVAYLHKTSSMSAFIFAHDNTPEGEFPMRWTIGVCESTPNSNTTFALVLSQTLPANKLLASQFPVFSFTQVFHAVGLVGYMLQQHREGSAHWQTGRQEGKGN